MRSAPAGLAVLAGLLSGCVTQLEVVAQNHTRSDVQVQVWINHTREPSWHRSVTVPAGERVPLGVFDGPAHDDYSMVVTAGPLRLERGQQQLGSSYPSWTLDIFGDRIEDRLMVY